ncbi:MAG: flavodoxin family protein [Clostridia bacterium]|nr:flavodoxin family protein [Clostridia bacterium]
MSDNNVNINNQEAARRHKVLILLGSPHKEGTTFGAVSELDSTLREEGMETEIMHVGGLGTRGCIGCYACGKLKKCVIDDIVNVIAEKLKDADGLVLASPVYYAAPNGEFLALCDRLFYSSRFDKSMKVGASVVVARRGGCTAAFDVLNKYFTISGMPIAPSMYWNQVHGGSAEDAREDLEGMQTMRALGRNMAFLIKSIALGKEMLPAPEKEKKIYTNFIRKA